MHHSLEWFSPGTALAILIVSPTKDFSIPHQSESVIIPAS